jgi:MFS family permease
MSRSKLVVVSAGLSVALSLLLVVSISNATIWPLVVALRLFAIGVYMVCFSLIGDTFKGTSMLSASAAVSMLWGLGGLVAPPIAGMAIDSFGATALPLLLAGVFALFLGAVVAGRGAVLR